jgi:hypothetical protein
MPKLIVQLNHPGNQKAYVLGKGYQKVDDLIIREWNDDPQHYRKFLRNDGQYLTSLESEPENGKLLFWGEWEGNSVFKPFKCENDKPNGIHEPFHSTWIKGFENTDPYIYGEYFKYATCKQSGQLCDLDSFSLILFGSTYPSLNAFYLDTVFVVKCHETAIDVCSNNGSKYSLIYKEETLEEVENDYLGPDPSQVKKLYHGSTWWENKEFFSFVPCKPDDNTVFNRLKIDLSDTYFNLSANPTGKSFLKRCNGSPQEVWNKIVQITFGQGFCLGVQFDEPQKNDEILKGFQLDQTKIKANCRIAVDPSLKVRGCK